MPYDPPPDLAGLSLGEIAALVAEQKLPPVRDWNPASSGESDMRIDVQGRWYHQGGLIRRPAMVRAFSRLLRRDGDGSFWLVTPVERLSIAVEDAPFVAVEMQVDGAGEHGSIAFRLNTDDLVVAGPEHPISVRDGRDGAIPYVMVRDGLDARLSRPVYYELSERALTEDERDPAVWSNGVRFPLVVPA